MEDGEKVVIEGLVSIGRWGEETQKVVWVWSPRPDKASNLADFIEAAFGSEDNIGLYGPMRITIERTGQ